jgi:radical SAM superfamily enzyme YgiQ (UPF0313 family)
MDRRGPPRDELRAPGGVLLVSCYELGHQPVALGFAAGFLERAGFSPALLDIAVEPFDAARAARARLVAISVPMHTALRLGARVAARVREANPAAHVCLFGLYASLNAPHLLAHGADSVIGGEAEAPLVALAAFLAGEAAQGRALRADGRWPPIPGVRTQAAPAPPHLARLDFAAPARAGLPPLERYARLVIAGEERLAGTVEASRGCLHMCRHCPIPPVYGGRFFVVPEEVVLSDIARLVAAGARHVTFGDPDFLNGPTHSLRVVRAMHREFPDVTFDFTAKVEHLLARRALLPELAAAGCVFIVSALESLSDVVLAHLAKGHTRADAIAVIRAVRAAGIALRPSFVAFTPWTTLADYRDALEVVRAEGLVDCVDPVQWAIRLLVPPGSLLLEGPAMRPFLGPLDEAAFTYRWAHPDPRMEALEAEVGAAVERAAREDMAPRATFAEVRRLAARADGRRIQGAAGEDEEDDGPAVAAAPRLSEPWFC